MVNQSKYLIVIVGPTAVGKTSLSIELAQKIHAEIISCDSRQFYKELEIGTAKPSKEEIEKVPHHFVNNLSIADDYTVMNFEKEALLKINKLHENNDFVIMTGGSGLFYKSIVDGFDEIPNVDPKFRKKLIDELESKGIENLQNELKEKDFEHYSRMDIQNSQRLIRALEICRSTGNPYSFYRTGKRKQRPFKIIKIGLEMEREKLFTRIDYRMDLMLKEGLLDEVKLLEKYKQKNALQTVGYKEIFDFLDNKYDWDECVRLLKRNSRRYAKRQLTWFKKDIDIKWFNLGLANNNQILESVISYIKS